MILVVGTVAGTCSTTAQSSTANSSIVCQSPSSSNISPGATTENNHEKRASVVTMTENKTSNSNTADQTMSRNDDQKGVGMDNSSLKVGSRQPLLSPSPAQSTSATPN